MKLRLNKTTLAQMPQQVRYIVQDWRGRYGKTHISVETCPNFYIDEDARVTMINLMTNSQQTEQAAGDFSGMTRLSPASQIMLPEGMVAVVTGFFLGVPYLNIFQGGKNQIA